MGFFKSQCQRRNAKKVKRKENTHIRLPFLQLLRAEYCPYQGEVKVAQLCLTLCNPMDFMEPARLLCSWNFPGKNTGVGIHSLLQGIFSTQGSNPNLLHWQADSLPLSHHGSSFLQHFVVQSLSHVQLFVTPWTAVCQASLSFTISRSLLQLMYIESLMPSNHLIFCRPLLLLPQSFLASGSFPMSQLFTAGGQSIGASASASVLPMNIQG